MLSETTKAKENAIERNEIEREKREHDTQFVKDELTHLQTLLDSIGKK